MNRIYDTIRGFWKSVNSYLERVGRVLETDDSVRFCALTDIPIQAGDLAKMIAERERRRAEFERGIIFSEDK